MAKPTLAPTEKYDPERKCVKCGNLEHKLRWFEAKPGTKPPTPEMIRIVCGACEWVWWMLPLDYVP